MQQKRGFFIYALHIFVLFSFALAQPLFDLLSRSVEFFVARHSKPEDVILLVLILCILLPAIVVLIEAVTGLFGRVVRKYAHTIVVACLVSLIALQILKRIEGVPGTVLLIGAAVLGIAAAIAYIRFNPVQMFLTVLSPAILIFPGLFIFNPQVSKIVFVENTSETVYAKVDATAPVVMVIFDELSVTSLMNEKREIDPIRYPNFAALAEEATWFRNATTVADGTTTAVPAILSGSYAHRSRIPTAADYPHSLFTLLGGSYRMKVLESHTMICPKMLCGNGEHFEIFTQQTQSLLLDLSVVYLHMVFPSDITANLPVVTQTWKDFWVEIKATAVRAPNMNDVLDKARASYKDRPGLFAKFVQSITATDRPTLYFLHIMLPHLPWEYLPSGKRYTITGGEIPGLNIKAELWGGDDWLVIQSYQRYLLQVAFVDKMIGDLLAKLKALNLYDRAVIIITADHGISFRPNDFRRPLSKTNFQDIMPVPLFIKAPNQHEGVISDRNVETIDILTTIADILDIRLPWPVDGHSVLDLFLPERKKKVISYKDATERMVVDFNALETKYVTLEHMLELFGSGAEPDTLFKIGYHKELIGRHVSEIEVAGDARVTTQLDQSLFFTNVDPEATIVPAHITGRVLPNVETQNPLNLALAVNGMIHAVTRTFQYGSKETKFSAMVPETAFRSGKNEVEVFKISKDNGQLRLERMKDHSTVTYSLASSGTITSSNGASISVIPNALEGSLDIADIESDHVIFTGWAADVKNSQLPDAIVIFVNGKFFYSGRCNADRLDVAEAFKNKAIQGAGFKYLFPLSMFENIADPKVRIFAVSREGVASELHYPKGYKWGKKP